MCVWLDTWLLLAAQYRCTVRGCCWMQISTFSSEYVSKIEFYVSLFILDLLSIVFFVQTRFIIYGTQSMTFTFLVISFFICLSFRSYEIPKSIIPAKHTHTHIHTRTHHAVCKSRFSHVTGRDVSKSCFDDLKPSCSRREWQSSFHMLSEAC